MLLSTMQVCQFHLWTSCLHTVLCRLQIVKNLLVHNILGIADMLDIFIHKQNLQSLQWGNPWYCDVNLAMAKNWFKHIKSHVLDRLTLSFIHCHCVANWYREQFSFHPCWKCLVSRGHIYPWYICNIADLITRNNSCFHQELVTSCYNESSTIT